MQNSGLTWAEIYEWLNLLPARPAAAPEIAPRFNVAPTMMVPIIRQAADGTEAGLARWGLIPHWYRGDARDWRAATFNARSEDMATKPTFRDAHRHGRCLVVTAGYYEWQKVAGGSQPYYFRPAGNAPALVLAGLCSTVALPDYQGLTCTVVTEAARPELTPIHDRTPVMLAPDSARAWLDGAEMSGLARLPTAQLAWHRVGHSVGQIRNDGPELIEAID